MLSLRDVFFVSAVLLVAASVFVGCSSQNASQPTTGPTSSSDWETGLDKDVVEAFSQLSADDRTAALAQKVCPVAGKDWTLRIRSIRHLLVDEIYQPKMCLQRNSVISS